MAASPVLRSGAGGRRGPNARSPATQPAPRPSDATLTVTKAARLLGVHPNTVRAWSDQGRLRFYRINARGDRRYRLADLRRFMESAAQKHPRRRRPPSWIPCRAVPSIGAGVVELRTRPARPEAAIPPPPDASSVPGTDEPPVHLFLVPPPATSSGISRQVVELDILGRLADLVASGQTMQEVAAAAADLLHGRAGHGLVAVLQHCEGRFVTVAEAGGSPGRRDGFATAGDLPDQALTAPGPLSEAGMRDAAGRAGTGARAGTRGRPGASRRSNGRHRPGAGLGQPHRTAVAIPGQGSPWGVLLTADDMPPTPPAELETFLAAVARQLGLAVNAECLRGETATRLQRAEALRRIATDIGTKLDLRQVLSGVVDHAQALFGAERAAVFLHRPNGHVTAEVARNLSEGYLATARDVAAGSLPAEAAAAGRPLFAMRYRDDPRAAAIRAAVIEEGFDTICAAPLLDGDHLLGLLVVYHDEPHAWAEEDLATLGAVAAQTATAITNAQDYERMAAWTAQLGSIQQLGARLARLTTEQEIGTAIAKELDQLVTYHNVRVYRLRDDGWLVPVAIRGLLGEFRDETPDQLRIRLGEGITGWVAAHRVPQYLPDAAHDPRSQVIPGTDENLDESMLLAPLIFEDQVLGVIVLSKLGLHQFSDDDLRLLVIYASLAAQALANADATERLRAQSVRLERRLAAQRALLEVTGSILETLELPRILGQVTDHLAALVHWDNICIEWVDTASGLLTPLVARGIHLDELVKSWQPGQQGLATWVLTHGTPQLVRDEAADPRVRPYPSTGVVEGSIICVPLYGRNGVRGVVSLERLGTERRFDEDDFELVQLFASQVSIAIRNAEAYRDMEIEAQTDDLTGLLNQGTFARWLARTVDTEERFGLVMLDLDEFKSVNDSLGHQAGDDVLRAVAGALRSACRDTDRVFRYGGDEFMVLCPGADRAGALALAGRIRHALRAVRGEPGQAAVARVSASLGVATYPEFGPTSGDMLLAADRACFLAKRRGRDQIATADDGLALAGELTLHTPTPLDPRERVATPAAAGPGGVPARATRPAVPTSAATPLS